MGYQVEYEPTGKVHRQDDKKQGNLPALTAAFLLAFLLLVNGFWPRGREVLCEIFFPGDAAVTAAALDTFAQELRDGKPVGTAVESFCRCVIGEAGIGQG